MGQEKNKENMGINAYYEGFGGFDMYFCACPLLSTSNAISEGVWNILDTCGLCSANFLRLSDIH